jgi:hypothetical protein
MVRERERGKTKEATAAPSCKKEAFDKWVIETQNKTKQNKTKPKKKSTTTHTIIHSFTKLKLYFDSNINKKKLVS